MHDCPFLADCSSDNDHCVSIDASVLLATFRRQFFLYLRVLSRERDAKQHRQLYIVDDFANCLNNDPGGRARHSHKFLFICSADNREHFPIGSLYEKNRRSNYFRVQTALSAYLRSKL